MNTQTLSARVAEIENLLGFSKKSGIPHRTLARIKAGAPDYLPSKSTEIAIEAALKRLKPAMRTPEQPADESGAQ